MNHVKFSRTVHLPWSLGATSDDKILKSVTHFERMREVVVTEKLDGENTTGYVDHIHARSLDSAHHWSRTRVKGIWAGKIVPAIVSDLTIHRVCGENMQAVHSIEYTEMLDWFYVFAVFGKDGWRLSWDEMEEFCDKAGLLMAPVLYRGPWDERVIKSLFTGRSKLGGAQEGYVVANADPFRDLFYTENVAKFVRRDHVQTDEHWMHQTPRENKVVPR